MTWSQVTTTLLKQQRQLAMNWMTVNWTLRLNSRQRPRLRPSPQQMPKRLVQLFWTRPMVILVKYFPVQYSICIRRMAQSLPVVWPQMLRVRSKSMIWSQVTTTSSKQQRQLAMNWMTVNWTSRLNYKQQPKLRLFPQRMLKRLVQLFWTRPTVILVKHLPVRYSICIRKTALRLPVV